MPQTVKNRAVEVVTGAGGIQDLDSGRRYMIHLSAVKGICSLFGRGDTGDLRSVLHIVAAGRLLPHSKGFGHGLIVRYENIRIRQEEVGVLP